MSAIDANLNRAQEGLRVCEDLFRFSLRRIDLSERMKELRHRVSSAGGAVPCDLLLGGRDVEGDRQKFIESGREGSRGSLEDILSANIHRAMEAARSLEEFMKLAGEGDASARFREIRFALYEMERAGISAIRRSDRLASMMQGICAVMNVGHCSSEAAMKRARAALQAGASSVRIASGGASDVLFLDAVRMTVGSFGAAFIIVDDRADIASCAGAGGVHLSKDSIGCENARLILPLDAVIGADVSHLDDAARVAKAGADYLAVGPLSGPSGGMSIIPLFKETSGTPILAVGEMTPESAIAAIEAGAGAVTVLCDDSDESAIAERVRAIKQAIEHSMPGDAKPKGTNNEQ